MVDTTLEGSGNISGRCKRKALSVFRFTPGNAEIVNPAGGWIKHLLNGDSED